ELGIGELAARIARVGLEVFDRHLAVTARPFQMLGLAADVANQTCKTAAQSRTRFVGHRQLPWIHPPHSTRKIRSDARGSPSRPPFGVARAMCRRHLPLASRRAQFAFALDHFGRELEV